MSLVALGLVQSVVDGAVIVVAVTSLVAVDWALPGFGGIEREPQD